MKALLVVGYGNMAEAILRNNEFVASQYHIMISGRNEAKIEDFINRANLKNAQCVAPRIAENAKEPIIDVDGKDVLLCLKPKGLYSFCFTGKARYVYSVMAGVSIETINANMQCANVVRLMPNIAAFYKHSATAVFIEQNSHLTSKTIEEINAFIKSFGIIVNVQTENLIDASIATSGSAIAFLSLIAESLVDAGVYEGLSVKQSTQLVQETFAGFSQMLSEKSPSEIKYAISSPNGTTIRGIATLEECGLRGAIIKAAHTAAKYALKMSKKASKS